MVLETHFSTHLSNSQGGWNKRGGGAKVAKSINVEVGIFWKKLVHDCNKRGVEGGFFFSKLVSVTSSSLER